MFDKHRYRYGKFANYVLGSQYRIAGKLGGLNEMIRVSWELSRSRYTDVFHVLLNNSALTSTASRQPSLCPCCFAPSAIWGISGQKRGKGRIDGKTFIPRRVNVTHANIPACTSHAENVHSISRLVRTLHSSSIWTNMKLFSSNSSKYQRNIVSTWNLCYDLRILWLTNSGFSSQTCHKFSKERLHVFFSFGWHINQGWTQRWNRFCLTH